MAQMAERWLLTPKVLGSMSGLYSLFFFLPLHFLPAPPLCTLSWQWTNLISIFKLQDCLCVFVYFRGSQKALPVHCTSLTTVFVLFLTQNHASQKAELNGEKILKLSSK